MALTARNWFLIHLRSNASSDCLGLKRENGDERLKIELYFIKKKQVRICCGWANKSSRRRFRIAAIVFTKSCTSWTTVCRHINPLRRWPTANWRSWVCHVTGPWVNTLKFRTTTTTLHTIRILRATRIRKLISTTTTTTTTPTTTWPVRWRKLLRKSIRTDSPTSIAIPASQRPALWAHQHPCIRLPDTTGSSTTRLFPTSKSHLWTLVSTCTQFLHPPTDGAAWFYSKLIRSWFITQLHNHKTI